MTNKRTFISIIFLLIFSIGLANAQIVPATPNFLFTEYVVGAVPRQQACQLSVDRLFPFHPA